MARVSDTNSIQSDFDNVPRLWLGAVASGLVGNRKNCVVEGEDYFFVSEEEFKKRVADDCFIEHVVFSSNHYGTEKRNIDLAIEKGCDLLLDIDVQGVEQLKQLYPKRLVCIFVFPPSFDALVERLRARGTESEEQIESRLEIARKEIAKLREPSFSDYLVINDQLEASTSEVKSIVIAERNRLSRKVGMDNFFIK